MHGRGQLRLEAALHATSAREGASDVEAEGMPRQFGD